MTLKILFFGSLMTAFIFLTAFTVSIDSFFCGFSLSAKETGGKLKIVGIICSVVLIMCLFANYSAILLNGILTEKTASLGGIILIAIGIFNLLKKDEKISLPYNSKDTLSQSILAGFAVGLDGAFANLSLAVMGYCGIYVPIIIALMHAFTITLGIILSDFKVVKKLDKYGFLPSLVLIALGIYKLTALIL